MTELEQLKAENAKLREALKRPFIGLGIIIEKDGLIAVGERIANHGSETWMIPGGHLEFGEDIKAAAKREAEEECGLTDIEITDIVSVGNDIAYDRHYVSIVVHATWKSGELFDAEAHKSRNWHWHDPKNLPQPMFIPSERCIKNWLAGKIYTQ
jgi:8-oxo-dGTP diphosphatase